MLRLNGQCREPKSDKQIISMGNYHICSHRTHPNERILEVDAPLSYGMADVKQEPATLNSVSFLWDPTRDTGVFVKVHCISTEFTPKKHGGERGVPFRLQVNFLLVTYY